LEVYDKALLKENPDRVCGPILLTHGIEAPTGFLGPDNEGRFRTLAEPSAGGIRFKNGFAT
jgi:hypothetical protein